MYKRISKFMITMVLLMLAGGFLPTTVAADGPEEHNEHGRLYHRYDDSYYEHRPSYRRYSDDYYKYQQPYRRYDNDYYNSTFAVT